MQGLFLILQRDDPLSLQTACGLLATAASMGRPAAAFLTFGALQELVSDEPEEDQLELRDPAAQRLVNRARDTGSLADSRALLAAARETGQVRLFACSASVRILQLRPEQLEKVDTILGLAAFLSKAEAGQLTII